jgi:RNA recognition motif-containing protein
LNLFIYGLCASVTELELESYFATCGDVVAVQIVRTPSGESRKFGFVEMSDEVGGQKAIGALDGRLWHGRRLQVRLAEIQAGGNCGAPGCDG